MKAVETERNRFGEKFLHEKTEGPILNNNINLGSVNMANDFVNVKTNTIITLQEDFFCFSEDGPIHLPVTVTADFQSIPQKYHEVFLNIMTAKYLNKVSFGENPFSQCKPVVKRKWWQFWKSQYFSM